MNGCIGNGCTGNGCTGATLAKKTPMEDAIQFSENIGVVADGHGGVEERRGEKRLHYGAYGSGFAVEVGGRAGFQGACCRSEVGESLADFCDARRTLSKPDGAGSRGPCGLFIGVKITR